MPLAALNNVSVEPVTESMLLTQPHPILPAGCRRSRPGGDEERAEPHVSRRVCQASHEALGVNRSIRMEARGRRGIVVERTRRAAGANRWCGMRAGAVFVERRVEAQIAVMPRDASVTEQKRAEAAVANLAQRSRPAAEQRR
jgi:hypothetical protein